jgi:glycine/D-amino acid oxidase-like deaminating enzyme
VISRRNWLGSVAAAGLLTGCGERRVRVASPLSRPKWDHDFRAVKVSEERVIRTVAGLRPYRPAGFAVRREALSDKVLVHNYGHGGGGITLSWGTAHLAVELAKPEPGVEAAVLGCGAVGLATARLLQRRGAQVTIYASELPPDTTSNIAGGQWWPTSVYGDEAPAGFEEQFVRAARLSYLEYQRLPAERYGISWVRNYVVSPQPLRNSLILGPDSPLRDLYPEYADLPENATPFDRYSRRFTSMLIEPPVYLPAMMQDVYAAGGRVVVRKFDSTNDVAQLPESLIVNCTGLGAGKLFGDKSIYPVKGQLTFLLPQREVDYNLLGGGGYMFPRRDGILLGGTFERNVWDLTVDREAQARILEEHKATFAKIGGAG